MGANISSQVGKTLATVGQYLLPLVFLTGAGISAFGRHKRAKLFEDVREGSAFHLLNGMIWMEFEMLVGEAFRRKGYSVSETGGGGADGGVDLVLRKDGEKFLVQCKHWKAYKVGVTVIRELYGVMAASGAVGGFVVTSGVFTQEAKSFAEGINIELIEGAELIAMIKKVQRQPQSTIATTQPTLRRSPTTITEPNCPKCGSTMSVRTAKQGANIGKTFWGCTGFPQCRGVVSID
jgi:restriction system protein